LIHREYIPGKDNNLFLRLSSGLGKNFQDKLLSAPGPGSYLRISPIAATVTFVDQIW
jgi:hypothetical protein